MIATIYGCISTNDESVQTPKVYEYERFQEQLIRRSEESRRNDAIHETLRFIEKYAERLEGELGRYQILSGESTEEMRHNTFAIQKFSVDEQYKFTHDGKEWHNDAK